MMLIHLLFRVKNKYNYFPNVQSIIKIFEHTESLSVSEIVSVNLRITIYSKCCVIIHESVLQNPKFSECYKILQKENCIILQKFVSRNIE